MYIRKLQYIKSQAFVNTNMIHAILLPPNVIRQSLNGKKDTGNDNLIEKFDDIVKMLETLEEL